MNTPVLQQPRWGVFISNMDTWPRMFSVSLPGQNCSYKTRSDTAVDVKQNGAHEAKKVDLVVMVEV